MRKAPETRDDLEMAPGRFDVLRVQALKQRERAALRGEVLRMREGQIDKSALDWREQPIELPRDRFPACGERHRIAREGARRAAEHVARKLVERHDEGERCERRRLPPCELAARRPLPGREKAAADFRVERFRLLEPQFARPAALTRIRRAEPEIEHLDKVENQLQRRRLAKAISIA